MTTEQQNLDKSLQSLSTAILMDQKEMAFDCIKDIRVYSGLEESPKDLTYKDALRMICNAWGITPEEIKTKSKEVKYSQPRFLYMYILYFYFDMEVKKIAKEVNCKYANVCHGKSEVINWLRSNSRLRNISEPIINRFEEKRKANGNTVAIVIERVK